MDNVQEVPCSRAAAQPQQMGTDWFSCCRRIFSIFGTPCAFLGDTSLPLGTCLSTHAFFPPWASWSQGQCSHHS